MPQILTTKATIVCPHGGLGTSIPSDLRASIDGGVVLLDGDVGTLACPFVPIPCVGYRLQSMGLNATKIGDKRVMLITDFTKSFTGFPLMISEMHQAVDNSTLAPLQLGVPAPPLPPALSDVTRPIVTVIMPLKTVKKIPPPLVPAVSMTFLLASPYPRAWILTWQDYQSFKTKNITEGLAGGIVATPSGGAWSDATLSINVVIAATFITSELSVGKHDFILTAINQRGLSSFAQATLSVT